MRTYHNTLNDWLTREDEKLVIAEMAQAGWELLPLAEDWEELLRGAIRPPSDSLRRKGHVVGSRSNWHTKPTSSRRGNRHEEGPSRAAFAKSH